MAKKPRFDLVFVLGVAHCGSTLVGRILNSHPQVYSPGELLRLDDALRRELACGCGEDMRSCAYWQDHLPWLESEYGNDRRRFDQRLYARLAAADGAEVAVDLSKTEAWRHTRRWKDPRVGYVLLLRDSRGSIASALRMSPELDRRLRKHKKWMRRLPRFVDGLGDRGMTMTYEDLCSDTEGNVRRLAEFIGIDYDPCMLRPADKLHHFCHSSVSGYLKRSNEIRLDERWPNELKPEDRARIEEVMRSSPVIRELYLEKGSPSAT